MRWAPALLVALPLLFVGCRTPTPSAPLPGARPLARSDPRPAQLLKGLQSRFEARSALEATARMAIDALGAGAGGRDLKLRVKQRLWMERPERLRVEVLGLFDSAMAVLTVDGGRYALAQLGQSEIEQGRVYDRLLWDAARLDLSPRETVDLILGAPGRLADGKIMAASQRGDRVLLELAQGRRRGSQVAEFGSEGELLRLQQRDAKGASRWEARYADFVEIDGVPFAREVQLRSPSSRVRIVLRGIELNPVLPARLFELAP